MKIEIPYGLVSKELVLPEASKVEIVYPNKLFLSKKKSAIEEALDKPLNCLPFLNWIEKKRNVLFIINDAARPTPTFDILKELDKRMNLEEARYIIATGAHRKPTDEELELIFREMLDKIKSNIKIHNAGDKKRLIKLGRTKRGTEVCINKEVIEAEAIISIGSVEPHYFAGFTGGRKSFFPGLAGYSSIEQNHKHALEKGAEPLSLEGNPVHLDFAEAFKKMPDIPIFSIQSVVKNQKEICRVFCGDIHESFIEASKYAKKVFCVEVKEKADILIAVAKPPLDKNLYQAHKAIEHGRLALKEKGILVLVAACSDGIGPDNFYKLLSYSTDPEKIIKTARDDYKLGYHKAARIAELSQKAEICVVSEIEDKILQDMFMRPFDSLQEAVNSSMDKKGKDAKILIITDGANTIPRVFDETN
jgi:nickel-dependent lactate racemase